MMDFISAHERLYGKKQFVDRLFLGKIVSKEVSFSLICLWLAIFIKYIG